MLRTRSASESDFILNPISTKPINDILRPSDNSEEHKTYEFDEFMSIFKSLTVESCSDLKRFLEGSSLWDIIDSIPRSNFDLIGSALISSYFSISDRVASICKLETDEFFFARNFSSFTESTLSKKLNQNEINFKRYLPALEHLNNYGCNILANHSVFWDSLNQDMLSSLSQSSRVKFLFHLYSALLNKNIDLKSLMKIFYKIEKNLGCLSSDLEVIVFDFTVVKGQLDYRSLATLLSLISSNHQNVNNLISNLSIKILRTWSNDSWLFRNSFSVQLHYSSCLVIVLSLLSPAQFSKEMEELLMNGVQSRLDHSDYQVRLLGTLIAEKLNNFQLETEAKLDFGLDSENEIVNHLAEMSDLIASILFPYPQVRRNMKEFVETEKIAENIVDLDFSHDYSDDDLEPISSLLKENLDPPKNSKKQLPKFLPECIKLLRENEDAEIVSSILKTLPEIYKSSSGLARQLHSVPAFNALLNMSDHYETKDFDQLRMISMRNILIDQVESVSPALITEMFHSNKLVLSQKLELMQVICSSAQQIFRGSTANHDRFVSNSALDYYEKSFLISESKASKFDKHKMRSINSFIDNLFYPLLARSIRHFQQLQHNHAMYLETFLWLQAILLNYSQNYSNYDRLVDKYFDLVHLCLNSPSLSTISGASVKLIDQIPIQKALLLGLSVVLTSWPASMSVLQYYPKMKEIYGFLEEVSAGPGFSGDGRLQALGSSVALALKDLTDHQRILQENSDRLSFDMKELKVSHLQGIN